MKRMFILLVLFLCFLVTGCGISSEAIKAKSISSRTDVFQEIRAGELPPKVSSDLLVKAEIKTHLEGYYPFEPKGSCHGKPQCPFVFNIDGQAVVWEVDGKKENTPEYDSHRVTIPDGGEGMRYSLEKKIRLHPGPHKVFFALPGEKYYAESEIVLEDVAQSILEFKPVYRNYHGSPTYLHGISRYDVFLNGRQLH